MPFKIKNTSGATVIEGGTQWAAGETKTLEFLNQDVIDALGKGSPELKRLANDAKINRVDMGYVQMTSLAAAVPLEGIKEGATSVRVEVEGQPVRWRGDNTNPTASVGNLLAVGAVLEYNGVLESLRFIQTTASAKLSVTYYG